MTERRNIPDGARSTQDRTTKSPAKDSRPLGVLSFEEEFGNGRLLRRGVPQHRVPEMSQPKPTGLLPEGLKITEID